MAGLMYPAFQKYYSAICNLRRFSIEKNFFDNISSLDNFFSEYRSVTLVMQKSLAHTPYIETYNKVSVGIWDKFFNDQRVKVIHTHPIEFTKVVDVTVYSPRTVDHCRKRLRELGHISEMQEVTRFLNKTEKDYKLTYVAAGISSCEVVDSPIVLSVLDELLEIRSGQKIFFIHGRKLMDLTHDIFERCTK